jgi:hypothetical protein
LRLHIDRFEFEKAQKKYEGIEIPGELDFVIRRAIKKAQEPEKDFFSSLTIDGAPEPSEPDHCMLRLLRLSKI